MKKAKKFFKGLTAILGMLVLLLGTAAGAAAYGMPDSYCVTAGGSLNLNQAGLSVKHAENNAEISAYASANQVYQAKLMLFDAVPVKDVKVSVVDEIRLVPCGTPFGIKMFTNGVVIVGVADIQSDGRTVNPAAVSGLKVGDIITAIDGRAVTQNEQVAETIEASEGKPLELSVVRDDKKISVTLSPVRSDVDSTYKGGLWVRDSTAGIGTVTFYDPKTGAFGGLGHGICDVDTNKLMPLGSGEVVPVTISGIVKGQKGHAGELRGYFNSDFPIGNLQANSAVGVYGTLNSSPVSGKAIKVAMKQEVQTGPAQIYTTVDGGAPRTFDIQIESINYHNNAQSKNLVVCVTDPELLKISGGIVQGMSGSPIIQNGMLVGAVTHVFINDPTRGYGILAENMVEISQKTNMQSDKKAS